MKIHSPLCGTLTALALLSLISPASNPALAQDDSWSVSAANWMQYWYHRPEPFDSLIFSDRLSRQDSLDNRFIVDFSLGEFYAGAWLRVLEPYRLSDSYEKLTQRYFGWNHNGLTIHAGNFYMTFDRGLTLNAFLDDVVNFDNNLDGVKVSGMLDHYDFDAFSARGLRFGSDERTYTLRGARGAIKPLVGLKGGFSYVKFMQNNELEFGRVANTNLTSFNTGINKGPIEIYGEYAWKRGRDAMGMKTDGDGTYLSGSISHSLASVYAEYENIIRLAYPELLGNPEQGPFNLPPPVSHQGRSLISKYNARGSRSYQVGILSGAIENVNFDLAFSEQFSRGKIPSEYLSEKYGGVRWSPTDPLTLNFHWDRHDYTSNNGTDSTGNSSEDEIENYIDGYFYLSAAQTVSITTYTKRFTNETWLPGVGLFRDDYHEDYLILGYATGSRFQLSVGGSLSNREPSTDPEKLAFVEMTLRFKWHELVVFHGGERGGLICSSGICSFRPTFQGTRVILFSRF